MSARTIGSLLAALGLACVAAGPAAALDQAAVPGGQKPNEPVVVQGARPFADLDGTRWTLASATLAVPPPDDTRDVTLEFRGANLQMGSGCNHGTASYSVSPKEHTLTIGAYPLTRMACREPVMAWENAFFKFLASRPTLARDGETLVLKSGDAEMRFKRTLK